MGDRLDLHRVRHDGLGDIRSEDAYDRHIVAGCLDDDFVRFLQPSAERLQPRAGHVDPAEMAQSAILPENDFSEGAVNIHSYDTTHDLSPIENGSGGRRDTYGSALSAQPGRSQGRPVTNTSSRLIV